MRPSRIAALVAVVGCTSTAFEPARLTPPPGEVWLTPEQIAGAGIELSTVERRTIERSISVAGRVEVEELRLAHVASPLSGRVARIYARTGQTVAKGSPLAAIDSPEMGSARADLASALSGLAAAERDWARHEELGRWNGVTPRETESSRRRYDRARADVGRAERVVRLIDRIEGAEGQRFILRSPIAGEVLSRSVTFGEDVQGRYSGSAALDLFVIADLSRVWVDAQIREIDLGVVRLGARMVIAIPAHADRSYEGRVEWISNTLDPVTRTATARCSLDNSERELLLGMHATVRVAVPADDVLTVPRSAVVRSVDHAFVIVQTGDAPGGRRRLERRLVRVEEEAAGPLPVLGGLESGEIIVISSNLDLLPMFDRTR